MGKELTVEERISLIEKQNAEQALEMDSLKKENIELKKKLAGPEVKEKEKPVIPEKPFQYKKEGKSRSFKFVAPFIMWKQERISATDALNSPEICKHLVETGSGFIQEVVE